MQNARRSGNRQCRLHDSALPAFENPNEILVASYMRIAQALEFVLVRRSRTLPGMAWLVYVFTALSSGYAADTNGLVFTNIADLHPPEAELTLRPIERFDQELIRNRGVIADAFGPPSYLEWTRRLNRERYGIHDHFNSLGAGATSHLIGYSVRETAMAILPIEEWKSFGRLLLGSVGNTAEERTDATSASFSEADQSWRQQLYQNRVIQYGVRPWRRDPYAYFATRVGHWGGPEDLPVFVFEGRVGYTLFRSSKVEGRLILPLPHRFQVVGGIATDVSRLTSDHTNPTVMSARLEYAFNQSGRTKAMYVGAQSGGRETLLAMGFTFGW